MSSDIVSINPRLPRHVAIIMDGNGRWANRRGLPRFAGHRAGVNAAKEMVRSCAETGIEVLTLFAFSSENWRRPAEEVGLLMGLFLSLLEQQVKKLHRNNIRLRVIGERTALSARLRQRIAEAEELTHANTRMNLVVAVDYGGRWDLTQAARELCRRAQGGELRAEEVSSELLESCLATGDLPQPDLLIRTGGEQRMSNFLLWQLAYTELYFTSILWPDFDRRAFERALAAFATRQRRFGRTSAQIAQVQAC